MTKAQCKRILQVESGKESWFSLGIDEKNAYWLLCDQICPDEAEWSSKHRDQLIEILKVLVGDTK